MAIVLLKGIVPVSKLDAVSTKKAQGAIVIDLRLSIEDINTA